MIVERVKNLKTGETGLVTSEFDNKYVVDVDGIESDFSEAWYKSDCELIPAFKEGDVVCWKDDKSKRGLVVEVEGKRYFRGISGALYDWQEEDIELFKPPQEGEENSEGGWDSSVDRIYREREGCEIEIIRNKFSLEINIDTYLSDPVDVKDVMRKVEKLIREVHNG